MWRRHDDAYDVELVAECESFLGGAYVERCEARGVSVPAWAWMNVLAHGTEAEIRAAAANRPEHDDGRQALAFVAGELVDLIDDGSLDLEVFQRDVLVPLELDVLGCPTTATWRPGQLAAGLLGTLPAKVKSRS
ncbi:MAG TPA: hypothetical protein VMK16_11285 [Acidimicrobiales bacterium]|nr:hypothetical protein [Acidimicrobiales bacterium]